MAEGQVATLEFYDGSVEDSLQRSHSNSKCTGGNVQQMHTTLSTSWSSFLRPPGWERGETSGWVGALILGKWFLCFHLEKTLNTFISRGEMTVIGSVKWEIRWGKSPDFWSQKLGLNQVSVQRWRDSASADASCSSPGPEQRFPGLGLHTHHLESC